MFPSLKISHYDSKKQHLTQLFLGSKEDGIHLEWDGGSFAFHKKGTAEAAEIIVFSSVIFSFV